MYLFQLPSYRDIILKDPLQNDFFELSEFFNRCIPPLPVDGPVLSSSGDLPPSQCGRRGNPLTVCRRTPPRQHVPPWLPERPCSGKTRAVVTSDPRDDLEPICCRCCQSGVWMMETMPELQEIKSEIGGVDFGAHGGSSASTTPQPHQNFQWVSSLSHPRRRLASDRKTRVACFVLVKRGKIAASEKVICL